MDRSHVASGMKFLRREKKRTEILQLPCSNELRDPMKL